MIYEALSSPERWLRLLLSEAATEGAAKALKQAGLPKVWLSKAEAYRLYGRSQVERWIAEGLFAQKQGRQFITASKIDRERLEAVAATSNRQTYLPVADR